MNDAAEPDVLERLTFDLLSLKLLLQGDRPPEVSKADLEKFSKNVADAMAEIERLRKHDCEIAAQRLSQEVLDLTS